MSKVKFSERKMEAWTSVVCMHMDDLWLGVKSLSNLAMAGSCWNMPKYSLIILSHDVKYGLVMQNIFATVNIPTQKLWDVYNGKQG